MLTVTVIVPGKLKEKYLQAAIIWISMTSCRSLKSRLQSSTGKYPWPMFSRQK